MPPSTPQLTAILSLAGALTQLACGGEVQNGGSGGALSGSGGAVGTGGSSPSGGAASADASHWSEATEGTAATAGCPVRPTPSICGEDGCDIGDSFTQGGGAAGASGASDECVFVVQGGDSGTCEDGETWGYCEVTFCSGHEYLSWQSDCLPVR